MFPSRAPLDQRPSGVCATKNQATASQRLILKANNAPSKKPCGDYGLENHHVSLDIPWVTTWTALLGVAVHCAHRERREADGDVFGAAFAWCRIANPFAGVGDDGLSRGDVDRGGLPIRLSVFDAKCAFQHNGELVKFGGLAGLGPSRRTAHVGDAGCGRVAVDASDVFVNELRFVAGGLNARCLGNECGHDRDFGFGFQNERQN
jgi:hypothetical protein